MREDFESYHDYVPSGLRSCGVKLQYTIHGNHRPDDLVLDTPLGGYIPTVHGIREISTLARDFAPELNAPHCGVIGAL